MTQLSEIDPNGLDKKAPGAKMDGGKSEVFRGAIGYFPRALEAVAQVSQKGAEKYAWKGWETVPDGFNRYSNALGRHLLAEGRGEVWDDGPGGIGLLHAAQVAWNALARLELLIRDSASKDVVAK